MCWNNILGHVGFRWVFDEACRGLRCVSDQACRSPMGLRYITDRSPMGFRSDMSVFDGSPIIIIFS